MLITGRISAAFKRQDWATVLIELVLVIAGILIALRLDQLAEDRRVLAQEAKFLALVRTDLSRDIADLENIEQVMTAVQEYGEQTIATLDADSCAGDCWTRLVAVFHASQWMDVRLNTATYEEIIRTGFPRDAELKDELYSYYGLGEQRAIVAGMPQYRELVRSIIPIAIQDYFWVNCWEISGRRQNLSAVCEPIISDAEAGQIIAELRAHPDTKTTLRFWLSTVSVTRHTIPPQIQEAERLMAVLSENIERMN